jgi:DNA-directed RNA polymerase subunit beta
MDVSPKKMVSIAHGSDSFPGATMMPPGFDGCQHAAPGPFLCLKRMPPLLVREWSIKSAVDSGVCILAQKPGTVMRVTSNEIIIANDDGTTTRHKLLKYLRSNQGRALTKGRLL